MLMNINASTCNLQDIKHLREIWGVHVHYSRSISMLYIKDDKHVLKGGALVTYEHLSMSSLIVLCGTT